MRFDFSAAELFLNYLSGSASLNQVFSHPAYQTVRQHAHLFGNGLTTKDLEDALPGKPSAFYGLQDLSENLLRIRQLLNILWSQEPEWLVR